MKLREIERLRAFAALLVVGVHWQPLQKLTPDILHDPWTGVDVFFVISGYVVTLSLVRLLPALETEPSFVEAFDRSRQALKTFYVRRFFRIMPAALTVALSVRLLTAAFPQNFGSTAEWLKEFIGFFGGVYNYMVAYGGHSWHLMVYWSLSVEEHFYLLLPVLFLVFRTTNRRLAACTAVALFSILSRSVFHPASKELQTTGFDMYCSHNRFDSLMAGVAIALVSGHLKTAAAAIMPRGVMRVAILPIVMVIVACLPGAAERYIMEHAGFVAVWVLSGVLVTYASFDRGYVLSVPGIDRVLEYIGSRSYAIYLLHQTVVRFEISVRTLWPQYAAVVPDSEKPWLRVAVLFALTFGAADILYRLVEKPCIRLGRRLIDTPAGDKALSRRFKALAATVAVVLVLLYYRHGIMTALGPRDLARGRAVYLSSHLEGKPDAAALTNGELESEFGAFTKEEDSPWATIDLGAKTAIGAIRVYNRDDGLQETNVPLEVQISDDNKKFTTIARRELMFTQEYPWRINCRESAPRYVRLLVPKHAALCLSEVEIFASRFMAEIP